MGSAGVAFDGRLGAQFNRQHLYKTWHELGNQYFHSRRFCVYGIVVHLGIGSKIRVVTRRQQ